MAKLKIIEHESQCYPPRTYHNAHTADVTIAFAVDFTTPGEILTRKAVAGVKDYIGINLLLPKHESPVKTIHNYVCCRPPLIVNIAGNSISRLRGHFSQTSLNKLINSILIEGFGKHLPKMIVTGGQTGADIAGAVFAAANGIDCIVTMPKGCRQSGSYGETIYSTPKHIKKTIISHAELLK